MFTGKIETSRSSASKRLTALYQKLKILKLNLHTVFEHYIKIENSHSLKDMHSLRTCKFLLTFVETKLRKATLWMQFSKNTREFREKTKSHCQEMRALYNHLSNIDCCFDYFNGLSKSKFEITKRKTTCRWCLCYNKRKCTT